MAIFRLFVNGKRIANASYPHGIETTTGRVHLDAGKPYQLLVEYGRTTATPLPHETCLAKTDRSVDPGRSRSRARKPMWWLRWWALPANSKARRCR